VAAPVGAALSDLSSDWAHAAEVLRTVAKSTTDSSRRTMKDPPIRVFRTWERNSR
jgi:hypothetical protein